ncbi:hypothetical protein IAT38_003512 [Cryptococcus sp. DSM 104549]
MTSSSTSERPIIILGAGIIGLTTAIRLLESPLYRDVNPRPPVHIIADHLPNDPLDAKYASTIAGAHHLSFADDGDERQRRWDMRTFKIMFEEWRQLGEVSGLMALKQTEVFVDHTEHLKIYEEHPDFTIIPREDLPAGAHHSVSFTSFTMTPLIYLNRLLTRIAFLSSNTVRIHRHHLPSLSSLSHPSLTAIIGPAPPLAIVVCAGIGALTLGGVEDTTVFPKRGQVVKVRAPWVRTGHTRQVGSLSGGEGGERTYVIPRADGEVILGGTGEVGDWYPYPREETTKDILRRALEICPDLCPRNKLTPALPGADPSLAGLTLEEQSQETQSPLEPLIAQTLVGFRPSRKDGTRLERGEDVVLGSKGEKMVVVHNYGHGGAGWQSCWGTAEDAVALLVKSLE